MVPDARLVDDLDRAAQGLVPLFENRGVLGHRDDLVGIAHHVQQGDAGFGQRFEMVDRIALGGKGLLFGQAVDFEALRPVSGAARAGALAAGPALDVADRRVRVDAGDLVGVLRRPVVDDQSAPAHALQGGPGRQAVHLRQVGVELIPDRDGPRRAEQTGHVDVHEMKTFSEQRDIGLRLVAEETGPPDPGFARRNGPRRDHDAFAFRIEEVVPVVGMERRLLPRERRDV